MKFDNGKYEIKRNTDGNLICLRYGEPWRDLTGDNLIYYMQARITELEWQIKGLKGDHSHE